MTEAADVFELSRSLVSSLTGAALLTSAALAGQDDTPEPPTQLDATLWLQQSAEARACCLQTWTAARAALTRGMADRSWTAAVEQEARPEAAWSSLPPAIVVDVDETVLDNSFHQARQLRERRGFDEALWHEWVREVAAPPIAGARDFCREAAAAGATVFYITNRSHEVIEATRRNLEWLGFPLDPTSETILPKTTTSDKQARRAQVAAGHRVVLMLGDNLADFASDFRGDDAAARMRALRQHAHRFGERWFVLPNPCYGEWEKPYRGEDPLAIKRAALWIDAPNPPAPADPELFYAEVVRGERLYVVGSAASRARVRAGQEPPLSVSHEGEGPAGETVVVETEAEGRELHDRLRERFRAERLDTESTSTRTPREASGSALAAPPRVAGVGRERVEVVLQARRAGDVQVRVFEVETVRGARLSRTRRATHANHGLLRFSIGDLVPGTEYACEVYVDGDLVELSRPLRVNTLE